MRTIKQVTSELSEVRLDIARLNQELVDLEGNGPGHDERRRRLAKAIAKRDVELAELSAELQALYGEEEQRDAERDAVKKAALNGNYERTDPPAREFNYNVRRDPWAPADAETPVETRGRALAAIERWEADSSLKQSATLTVERVSDGEGGPSDVRGVSEHVIRFSNPLYVSAFRKFTQDPETFAAALSPDERRVWAQARDHTRAALGLAGAVVPSPLDPTIVLTNDGDIDPMRSVARVDTTTSKEKRYITSAGSTFSFDPELAEVSDDTPTLAEVTISNHKAQGFIQASIEAWMDQPNFDAEIARIIADGKARLEADKFVTGTGTNEPKGIETALAGTTSEVNAAGEALVADDVYGLLEALPPRFRQGATWQLELSTINHILRLFNPSGTEPPLIEGDRMLRRPFVENSAVDPYSAVDPAVTATNRVLFVGDWRNYVVQDRIGLAVSFIGPGVLPNTANNRPDGRVGWYAFWRVGADILSAAAFRMLDVQTTL